MSEETKKHLFDLAKGAVGAAITAGVLAFLNYLGAHIPEVASTLAMLGAGAMSAKAKFG